MLIYKNVFELYIWIEYFVPNRRNERFLQFPEHFLSPCPPHCLHSQKSARQSTTNKNGKTVILTPHRIVCHSRGSHVLLMESPKTHPSGRSLRPHQQERNAPPNRCEASSVRIMSFSRNPPPPPLSWESTRGRVPLTKPWLLLIYSNGQFCFLTADCRRKGTGSQALLEEIRFSQSCLRGFTPFTLLD